MAFRRGMFFTIYTARVSNRQPRLPSTPLADDTEVYLSVPFDAASSATVPLSHSDHCIANVFATWFSVNRLRVNPANTQHIWLRSKRQVEKVNVLNVSIMAKSVRTVDSARDPGVVVDSHLTMTMHVM